MQWCEATSASCRHWRLWHENKKNVMAWERIDDELGI